MNRKITTIIFPGSPLMLLVFFAASLVLFTMIQDFIRADLHQSAFYFSESFIFSILWWIFVPMLYGQYAFVQYEKPAGFKFLFWLIVIPFLLHLIFYPVVVWLISGLFYSHTFEIRQTFIYTVSEYFHLLILFYTIPLFTYLRVNKSDSVDVDFTSLKANREYANSIFITEGNKRMSFAVNTIEHITANPPYVTVHIAGKNYLANGTLKSVSETVNPDQFVRVHKSSIVNISHVRFYTSRYNGDYDLTTNDGTKIRVSRNYARNFKAKFTETHRLDTK